MSASSRSTLVAVLVGLLALGGVVAFAVALPEGDAASEPAGTGSDQAPAELPDTLPGGLVALDSGLLPPELVAQLGDLESLQEQQDSAGSRLAEVYDAPSAFRIYAAEDQTAIAQVTVVDRAPGVFLPDFPPIDPELIGLARPAVELVEAGPDGQALCVVSWGAPVAAGEEIDDATPPQSLRCQQGSGERTYELFGQGLTADAAAEALAALV